MAEPPSKDSNRPPITKLYILVPPSPLFAAHWSFFLPDMLRYDSSAQRFEKSNVGRRLHVSGDRLNGFALELIRGYDVKKHRGVGSRMFPIGTIPSRCLQNEQLMDGQPAREGKSSHEIKDDDEGGGWIDNSPVDEFERTVLTVEAPGPSLNRVSGGSVEQARRKVAEARDCQWWVKTVVRELVDRDVLHKIDGEDDPMALIASLPVH